MAATSVTTAVAAAPVAPVTSATSDTGRDRLRFIAQQQCLPNWLTERNPAPCVSVTPGEGVEPEGFVVLADRKGGAHFLLIPTRTISGIESPELRVPGSLNYFESAWAAREVLSAVVGRGVPRSAIGMAVNQVRSRSQDQLHIHLSCLRKSVYDVVQAQSERLGDEWGPLAMGDRAYYALRVMGKSLGGANPFQLLAERFPRAKDAMAQFTLLVAGVDFKAGPGFALIAGRDVPGAELMLDSECELAF